ncbi:unnamed protein product, partial [Brassica rapa subsp. narinosa]
MVIIYQSLTLDQLLYNSHKDKVTKQVITRGSRHKDLYLLKNTRFQALYSHRQQATSEGIWHQRLGHPNMEVLQMLSRNKAIVFTKTSFQTLCDACQVGKSCQLPFLSSEFVSTHPLERIHCDLWGPSPIVSAQGFKYYVIFTDNFSRFTWFFPLKLKSDFLAVFLKFQQLVENQLQNTIKQFQCDGGGEFISQAFLTHLAKAGIQQRISCPHTPQQNGLSERKHRHLTELGMTMMFHGKVPQQLWVEAFFTANFLINLLPSKVLKDSKSPFEVLHSKAPLYTALRVFGCKCFPYLRPYMSNKMDPKSLMCVFVGYNEKYKGYRCYYPPTGKVFISRHVLFDESSFPFADIYSRFHKSSQSALLQAWRSAMIQVPTVSEVVSSPQEELPARTEVTTEVPSVIPDPPLHLTDDEDNNEEVLVQQEPEPQAVPPVHQMTTRARAGIIKPNPKYVLFTVKDDFTEPKSVKTALKHPGWNKAMGVEITNMEETETFELVPPSEEQNPLSSQWVYKTKYDADGNPLRLRARLVARGNEQEEGIDYYETFSPVVRTATIRTVLHIAVTKKWPLKQLDVQNAFLHGDLKETVYMSQPQGFVDKDRPDYVWKLKKAIYGLKQAPRAWFDKFSSFLLGFGFQ